MSEELKVEALKTLYEGQSDILNTLSQKSHFTTLQALTLNLAIVAGLAASGVKLTVAGQVVGTVLLSIFNIAVVWYLWAKGLSHHREKVRGHEIQTILAPIAGLSAGQKPSFCTSFVGGTLCFIFVVVLSAACAISSMWLTLIAR